MNSNVLIESFSEFAKFKNIDRPTMMSILEEVFRTMIRKKYNDDSNFDVIINPDNGDLEIYRNREIVDDDSEDIWDHDKIPLSEAQKIEPDFEIGEEVSEQVKLEDFGRRAVLMARQTLIQRVKDLERDNLYQKYKDMVGEIIAGEVYQVWGRETLVLDQEENELSLPKPEQIPKDRYRKGDNIRAVVHRVDVINGAPKIILSRAAPAFLERLMEQEVPEIFDGLITIKNIVREPGERAKVAVESYDDRIDPVGACVGMKGSRIHAVVRELENENIDIINYTDNLELYIQRALSPAKISSMKINEQTGRVSVFLRPDQVSLAIGRGGANIKLASRLVGMEIDVFREADSYEEDIALDEFSDELESWIIDELKKIGLDTGRAVLAVNKEDLVRRTELEEENVEEVFRVIQAEFDGENETEEAAAEDDSEAASEAPKE
ncbi:transcription termination/antitermination protein NusA [Hymenobacter busanensis]|uniref:Transcription termination/antitermination protein NusA n=1 Tax=Hymenobacter busanensis TaxID=2607656 RepID=A0A7L4ZXK9_9BACT|nr:transcription termination factor NusA [Hymenobacter busanensis]KAA9325551.1 transcription termination/antitermination protein NusA [Hymenobacter busanensis]QHJ07777.1 transcription termination/antitermination protein NusA [Hymenobacter busanensis]